MVQLKPDVFVSPNALRKTSPDAARNMDALLDTALAGAGYPERFPELQSDAQRSIFVALTSTPANVEGTQPIREALKRSRHKVRVVIDPRPDVWRFNKINEAARQRPADTDWLLIMDDDVAFGPEFLDRFIAAAEGAGLVLAQPAHRIHSYASHAITQRQARSLVRRTGFVEVGPLTAIHSSILGRMLPLPSGRWGWGVDFLWGDWAKKHDWKIGIVDATPIEHLRAPASNYSYDEAMAQANQLLADHAIEHRPADMLRESEVLIGW